MNTVINRRVLVIDDNASIHSDFRKVLCPSAPSATLTSAEAALFGAPGESAEQRQSFEVDSALQGERGHELVIQARAANRPYAVAFVDMRMPPGWDGVETAEHLWKTDPELQVVICTAYSDYSWDESTARLGRSEGLLLLKKPFDDVEVWQMASSLTEKWALRRRVMARLRESERLTQELQQSNAKLSREINARQETEERLRHNSLHDQLTGLPNRAYLRDRIEQCIQRRERHPDHHYAVLFLDIDNSKLVNDSLGHEAGDGLLVQVAQRLRASPRALDGVARVETETAARVGGDEFVVLMDGLSRDSDSALVAQRLLDRVLGRFELGKSNVGHGASIGIAVGGPEYVKADELLRDADIAMYRAKTAGKARYAMFDPGMHRAAQVRLQLENDLRQALSNEELRIAYQPIVALSDRCMAGLEALLRWQRGSEANCSPELFVRVAEESGLIIPIGCWVLEIAARQLLDWWRRVPQAGKLYVTVNVSRRQLLDDRLAESVKRVLACKELSAKPRLNREVTEGGVIEDFETAAARLGELKRLGVSLYMDDFGTGYSSLSCLHRLPFDVVKIDRSFTASMRDNASYAAVIRAVVALARSLNMKVVVEGIETAAQLDSVTELGCDFGQGYLFSPPLEPDAVTELLRRGLRLDPRLESLGGAAQKERTPVASRP
jgi:diguanylate cyclase (GGDEF)-like protein